MFATVLKFAECSISHPPCHGWHERTSPEAGSVVCQFAFEAIEAPSVVKRNRTVGFRDISVPFLLLFLFGFGYVGTLGVSPEIVKAGSFYPAEDYHQDYLQKNPGGYTCHYLRD
jgi:hypothetical protein